MQCVCIIPKIWRNIMNLPSALLFSVIFLAFAFTFFHLLKKVCNALRTDRNSNGETGCSCCSGKCSHCNHCGKVKL